MHSSSINTFNSSHASFNLFHLPTHNSTYHLAATTRDSRTNLGFIALPLKNLKNTLKQITKSILLQDLITKMDLEFIDHLTLKTWSAAWLGENAEIGRKMKKGGGNGGCKMKTPFSLPLIYFLQKSINQLS